jgi:S1/P1 Nuclease
MRALAILSLTLTALPAFAWGPEGHALIARIADVQLTPEVRARVVEILGPGKSMASVASWADEVRRSRPESGPWHYVDIPLKAPHLDLARDCAKEGCVVVKIAELRRLVHDPATPPEQRREALMFIIHFIGDMHQPLHCEDNNDRGGNSVQVQFFERRSNLHSVWDSGLLTRIGPEDQLFPDLSRESAAHARKYSKGTVTQWAEESHKTARKVVYAKLPKAAQGKPLTIDAAYEKAADPVVRHQIELAGARLAKVLNTELQ